MNTKIPFTVLALAAVLSLRAFAFEEPVRQALQGAATDVQSALSAASAVPAGKPVAVLPIPGDDARYVEGLLKNAVTAAGKTCVVDNDDDSAELRRIYAEFAWDERKADMLDAATLDRFGKLKSTKVLLTTFLRACDKSASHVFVELELHAYSIETKEHLWGGTFAKRFYLPGENAPEGLSEIPAEVRDVMREKLVAKLVESLKSQKKLSTVKSVALVPFAGDFDQYATYLFRDAVTKTALTPRDLAFKTEGEARSLLHDKPAQADALSLGALRGLSRTKIASAPWFFEWRVDAELQAAIENTENGDVLWSATIAADETYRALDGKWIQKTVPVALGVLVALILVGCFLKAATRAR